MSKKRVSIKDIAAVAGVSHPTVSRALRGTGRISEQTRARIRRIAEDLGYTPNLTARGLVTRRTRSVGLIVTDIGDPFHSEVIRGVELVTQEHQYSLVLGSTVAGFDHEMRVVRGLLERRVDGLIVASSQVGNRYADVLDDMGLPIVLVNSHAEGSNLHSVNHDDRLGASQMMDHLLEQGFSRIAFLGHKRAGRVSLQRELAWREKMHHAGQTLLVFENAGDSTIDAGYRCLTHLLARADSVWGVPPDAIFCYNDRLAIGVLSALRKHGLRVPDDVAVAGFDDLDVSAHLSPSLTTVHQPRQRIGSQAGVLLLSLLGRQQSQVLSATPSLFLRRSFTLRGNLIVRESTRRRPSTKI